MQSTGGREIEGDVNKEAFAKWSALVIDKPRYVAFVDGDPVESGNDFGNVATNASGLCSLRGEGAILSIYDTLTGVSTPK